MLDPYRATRDELLRIVLDRRRALADQDRRLAALEAQLAQSQAVIARLTAQLGAAGPGDDGPAAGAATGMPGLKATEAAEREARPRRKRARGAGRHRMAPTARVVHALPTCPDCRAPLAGGTVKRTREVIEIPAPAVTATEHVDLERRCPDCGRRCVPGPELDGVVAGRSRLGNRLVGLIAVLREEGRLPFAAVQALLRTIYGLRLMVGAVRRVARSGAEAVADLRAAIRAGPVLHADETGWREDGRNGDAWTLSTPDARLFVGDTREKRVLTETLGDAFAGVLVSDFDGADTGYEGRHQYCWAHLLRAVAEVAAAHPDDPAVRGRAEAVGAVFDRARAAARGEPAARRGARARAEAELALLCRPWLAPRVAQTPPCARILRHLESLFIFATDPAVPAANNAAERSPRPLVVGRKISGGTRSPTGNATKMALASRFSTWRARGINPFTACQELLASPQL